MTEQGTPQPPSRPQGKRGRSAGVSAWTGKVGSGDLAHSTPTDAPSAYGRPSAQTPTRLASRWLVVAIVAVPLLAFLAYFLNNTLGDTADIGETLTEKSGVELNVSSPEMYTADDTSPVTAGEKLYHVVVAVNNPTDKVISSSEFTITATVDRVPVEAVHPTGGPINQPIQPNVQLNVPFLFKVKDGTTGRLQITVRSGDREPVYFNGRV
jgi:hypothetical protein